MVSTHLDQVRSFIHSSYGFQHGLQINLNWVSGVHWMATFIMMVVGHRPMGWGFVTRNYACLRGTKDHRTFWLNGKRWWVRFQGGKDLRACVMQKNLSLKPAVKCMGRFRGRGNLGGAHGPGNLGLTWTGPFWWDHSCVSWPGGCGLGLSSSLIVGWDLVKYPA